jgi:hypothetical protein
MMLARNRNRVAQRTLGRGMITGSGEMGIFGSGLLGISSALTTTKG